MVDHEPLPPWVDSTRMESQLDIVHEVVDRFKGRNGHQECDVVFLQAPTGVGKTLIAELVSREMHAKTIYTCTTRNLQDQFARDFPYAKVLKGRKNYLTTMGMVDEYGDEVDSIDQAVTAQDCTWNPETERCGWCGSKGECPYVKARWRATGARIAVLNSAYLLTDAGGPRGFVNRDLYVLDEADMLEGELLSHSEMHLTNRRMKKLGISPPEYKTKDETWAQWIIEQALPKCGTYWETLPDLHRATDLKTIREIGYMSRLMDNMWRVSRALELGKWVHDGYRDRDYDNGDVIFKPVLVGRQGNGLLWQNGRKFLVMSATILTADVMAQELGITEGQGRPYDLVDIPSNFPVENRPIHVVPVANVTMANAETERPILARAVMGIIKRHPDERILIHCVSYDLARYLHGVCSDSVTGSDNRSLLVYLSTRDKEATLAAYKMGANSVLFAASLERGVDLPDDLCRVQVIAKVPWLSKGDKRTAARLYLPGGQAWYNMHAIRTIVQMSGRAVRHREDYAITYILDKQFVESLWSKNSRMFPRYFRDALNFRFNPRLITETRREG